jgi:sigma-B regulation protein RsbU (phosphoserine phosphatase)
LPLPLFENGEAINMVVRFSSEPGGFDHIRVADAILVANLFGRATSNLLVAKRLEAAYAQLDREMKQVAEIQRSLLPQRLPQVPGLDIAASYKTAARAGGDYYDFFDLGDGRWGLLVADVSGHGTPAAVVMSMLRTLLHAQCKRDVSPAELLGSVNERMIEQAHRHNGTFTTAFYGVYDPSDRGLQYACAGHNPPLLIESSTRVRELDEAQALPLAIDRHIEFDEAKTELSCGDTLLLYTDGITEATNDKGEMYGRERLVGCIRGDSPSAQHIIDCVTRKLIGFTGGTLQDDDQTLVALRAV